MAAAQRFTYTPEQQEWRRRGYYTGLDIAFEGDYWIEEYRDMLSHTHLGWELFKKTLDDPLHQVYEMTWVQAMFNEHDGDPARALAAVQRRVKGVKAWERSPLGSYHPKGTLARRKGKKFA